MKTSHLLVIGAVALLLVKNKGAGGHGQSTLAVAGQILDKGIPTNGSDFQSDMWARLHGADLTLSDHPNVGGGIGADPGPVGLRIIMAPAVAVMAR